jgi:hypothetical protein
LSPALQRGAVLRDGTRSQFWPRGRRVWTVLLPFIVRHRVVSLPASSSAPATPQNVAAVSAAAAASGQHTPRAFAATPAAAGSLSTLPAAVRLSSSSLSSSDVSYDRASLEGFAGHGSEQSCRFGGGCAPASQSRLRSECER